MGHSLSTIMDSPLSRKGLNFDAHDWKDRPIPIWQTPQFSKWFKGSKVLNTNGEPLTVFRGEHQSQDALPRSILGSVTFTDDPEVASLYAMDPNDCTRFKTALYPIVIPAYLSIKSPIINDPADPFIDFQFLISQFGNEYANSTALRFSDSIESTGFWQEELEAKYDSVAHFLSDNPSELGSLYMLSFPLLDNLDFVERAKKLGFDGAIYAGFGESSTATEFRVFDPCQVKSSIGNNGNFDPLDPRIEK